MTPHVSQIRLEISAEGRLKPASNRLMRPSPSSMMGRENSSGVRFSLLRMDRRFCESGVRGATFSTWAGDVTGVGGSGTGSVAIGSGVYMDTFMSATGSVSVDTVMSATGDMTTGSGVGVTVGTGVGGIMSCCGAVIVSSGVTVGTGTATFTNRGSTSLGFHTNGGAAFSV